MNFEHAKVASGAEIIVAVLDVGLYELSCECTLQPGLIRVIGSLYLNI